MNNNMTNVQEGASNQAQYAFLKDVPLSDRPVDRSAVRQISFLALGFIGEYGELVAALEDKQTDGCILDELSDVFYYGILLMGRFTFPSQAYMMEYPARNDFRKKTHFELLTHLANITKKASRKKDDSPFDDEIVATVHFLLSRARRQCFKAVDPTLFGQWCEVVLGMDLMTVMTTW